MMNIEEKRRLVRGLLREVGRGFAEPHGFGVTNNPGSLFQLLCLSVLLRRSTDYHTAVAAAQQLRDRGWTTAQKLAASSYGQRAEALARAGHRRTAKQLADVLGELGRVVADRHSGDLRRLRTEAHRDPGRERELLKRLPGVDDQVVDLFFREAQVVWSEVGPFADRRALSASRKLGLARTVEDLAELAKSEESERFAWLVGALAQVDLDRRHEEIRALVHQ
ncbi:hypothetical protein [Microbispora sp. NPDC046933]|uniref:hypothetical protein n=1 Tax=Microbispora sp. NPDC046933 TaxID=3155618 RepID=UPI0033EC3E50